MPSLTTLTFDSEDFETNSECTNIFFILETHHFLYPVPPYLIPYIPDPYFVIADWFFFNLFVLRVIPQITGKVRTPFDHSSPGGSIHEEQESV